ncbi:Hypothetical protein Rsl_409 [Rickettsia slovaca 13-B]|uniref:Uncharacterized protein n=1 Tax=Rickettsia slovaca (strain 13-B) TaxID=941638 RepID=A0ABM5MNM8_RICS1|nr:Hypothetical protein Rsl_409 [Rickettsia slovaca 13-B]
MRGKTVSFDEANLRNLLLFHEIVTQPTAARNDVHIGKPPCNNV